ncbi:MAG: hypothetical protein ABI782_00650 [Anaerolineaceae bacterium]
MRRRTLLISSLALGFAACGDRVTKVAVTPTRRVTTLVPTLTASTPTAVPATAMASPTAPSPTPAAPRQQPIGFPLDRSTRTGMVVGELGQRTIDWSAGIAAGAYSRDEQVLADPERANRCGWNARVHAEYEGQPAVDW